MVHLGRASCCLVDHSLVLASLWWSLSMFSCLLLLSHVENMEGLQERVLANKISVRIKIFR